MNKTERIAYFQKVRSELSGFTSEEIDNGIMRYCLMAKGRSPAGFDIASSDKVEAILFDCDFPVDLESVIEFFEILLEPNTKDENGIVFTPRYIADHIVESVFADVGKWSDNQTVIDPCCGSGIFLVAAAEYIHQRFSIPMDDVISNNIYGLEIDRNNVHHCRLIMTLLSAYHGGHISNEVLSENIVCCDSLKENWNSLLGIPSCDYVIGNPPYVNPHSMNKETVEYLKRTFKTTRSGGFNIYYAFIERSYEHLADNGVLGFIIPNNFLSIKAATDLRQFLQEKKCVKSILDFGTNMVFQPIRTYNCILVLSKQERESIHYRVMEKSDNIPNDLASVSFSTMKIQALDKSGWKLVDGETQKNISAIESQSVPIGSFIRTGIATLRDNVYLVDHDDKGYYKMIDGARFPIEEGAVKPIYKIPELKGQVDVNDIARYIIFPYCVNELGYSVIAEEQLRSLYPMTYRYLRHQRAVLGARDRGKVAVSPWYAYGRTQGLTKYGRKLLFPTFSDHPRFVCVDDTSALFCNGYAVFENDYFDLDVLCKILNSSVMDYYIRHTSYAIEGDYYCYQKKYIERFSIPFLTETEAEYIRTATRKDVDAFLEEKYSIAI